MKLICEVEISDRSPKTILDAMAHASRHEELWRIVRSREEMIADMTTNGRLDGKCGSCKHFKPFDGVHGSKCCGDCKLGHVWGERCRKACKQYERKTK